MNKLKKLKEQRNKLYEELEKLLEDANEQTRALTEDEETKFNDLEAQIKKLDATIALEQRSRSLQNNVEEETLKGEEKDMQDFAEYVRAMANNERAESNYTLGDNGAIVPQTIANKIIETLEDICPIYELSEHYNVAGKLKIPKYTEKDGAVTMAYAEEFVELTSTAGKFETIDLDGFLAGCLTKISKSLIKKAEFNLTEYVISKVALAGKRFLEKECLIGTKGKIEGMQGVTLEVEASSDTEITSDDLIDLQEEVIDQYQADAVWIMNRKTRKAIRKLKDGEGNYLLNRDFEAKWGWRLLGKDVYTTDTMPEIGSENIAIYYGDLKGLATKIVENFEIQVLVEKYATQHAIGVVAWTEIDSKVQNTQMLARLKCAKASTTTGS